MKRIILLSLAVMMLIPPAYAGKEYAERFPSGTRMEVYTPTNPPPASDVTETDPLSLKYANRIVTLDGDLAGVWSRGQTAIPLRVTDIGYGITIKSIVVSSSVADPTTELTASLRYADPRGTGVFPGANVVSVATINTSTGNYSSTGRSDAIPTGHELYVFLAADPVDIGPTWTITVTYDVKTS